MMRSTRKFDGKQFYLKAIFTTKPEAQKKAKGYRKSGRKARVIKSKNLYGIIVYRVYRRG